MGKTIKNDKTNKRDPYNEPFPKRLRLLLDRKGETQGKLAEAVGVHRQSIGQWKEGSTVPDINSLNKMADYYKVSTDYLLGRVDVESPDIEKQAICKVTGLSLKAVEDLLWQNKYSKADPNHPELISELLENPMFDIALSSLHNAVFSINRFYTSDYTNDKKIDAAINALEAEANKIGATVLWHFDAIGHYAHDAQRYISDCIGEYVDKRMMLKKLELERVEEQTKK